jgi:hypothetical protein
LKYRDTRIDEAILRALYINKTLTFNTLLEKAGRIRGKNYNKHSKKYEIARAAFNSHIKYLVKENMIDKYDHGRGKPVEYFLTYKAKQQIRLKFFNPDSKLNKNSAIDTETKEKRENMYLLLFFVLKDEQEMYDLLSSVNIHNKGAQHMFGRRYALEHMGLTKEELEEAFTLLKSEGLIDSIKKENNDNHQILYKIKDKSLYDLINDHLFLATHVRLKLILIWSHIRKPTIEETKC